MPLTATLSAPAVICDDASCVASYSHAETCRCSCEGEGHGLKFRTERAIAASRFQARRDVRPSGFTSAMFAATPDDEAF